VHHDTSIVLVRRPFQPRSALDDAVRTLRVRVGPVGADQHVVLCARRVVAQLDVVGAASVDARVRLDVETFGQVPRRAGFGGEEGAEALVEEGS